MTGFNPIPRCKSSVALAKSPQHLLAWTPCQRHHFQRNLSLETSMPRAKAGDSAEQLRWALQVQRMQAAHRIKPVKQGSSDIHLRATDAGNAEYCS